MTTDLAEMADSLLRPEPEATNPVEDEIEDAEIVDDDSDDAPDVDLSDEDDAESSTSDDDEEIANADEDEEVAQPETFAVIIDGKEENWTIEQLKQSASGQGAINKRFQEAAEMRKQLQSREQQLAQYEQQVLRAFEALQNPQSLTPPQPPSEDLLAKDPIGYLEADVRYKREAAAYQEQLANMQAVQQQNKAREQQSMAAFVEEQARILSEAIPEYGDPAKREGFAKSLIETGKRYNFSDQEMLGVTDSRYVMALNDARKYHELMANRETAKSKIQQSPSKPSIPAGAKKPANAASEARKKAQNRLRQTGSLQDAVSLIFKE